MLEFLAENIPYRLFIKDMSFTYIYGNDLFTRDYGLKPEDIIGKDDLAFHPEKIAQEYRRQDEEVLASGEKKQYVERYYPQGKKRWVRAVKSPYRDESGRIIGVLGFFEDITEDKKKAEKREQLSQELRLKDKAIESAIVAIAFGTPDGTLTHVNRAFLDIWGAESDEQIIGKSALIFWENPKEAEGVVTALYQHGSWTGEMKAKRLDGSVFDAFLSANSITDENGRVTHLMATFIDITESKKHEAAVREQAEQFNVFKETTRDGFLLVGADSKMLDANSAAAEMLGYTVEELKSMSIPDIEAAESREETEAHIQNMIETGSDIFQSRHRKKNGELIDVEVSVSFWKARNQFFSFVRDITTRREEERELEQLRKNLAALVEQRTEELKIALKGAENANRSKSRFLSRMSHELRTPLNGIIGFSQLLETEDETELNSEQRDNVREILKSGNHLLELIDTMLEFSAVNEKLLNLELEKVECAPVVDECLRTMRPPAAARNISFNSEIPGTCVIQADKNRFRQVLLSLISNAVKYNRENGSVTVRCETKGGAEEGKARITVTDTGIGIDPHRLDAVFEPFEDAETQYAVSSGIGIGLAMAKQLIEEMQGSIGVDSIKDKGSSFWIELPRG